jgi:hypothetical protein
MLIALIEAELKDKHSEFILVSIYLRRSEVIRLSAVRFSDYGDLHGFSRACKSRRKA